MTATGTIRGVITSETGDPVAGAQVAAIGCREHAPLTGERRVLVISDDGGRYSFDDLSAGTHYRISAVAADLVPGPEREIIVVLSAGEERVGIDIQLARGGVEVCGTVRDHRGRAIADAWVVVDYHCLSHWIHGFARCDSHGAFVTWQMPGPLHASPAADGYVSVGKTAKAPTRYLDLVAHPQSVLAGTVVDAVSGAPVAGASVSTWNDEFKDDGAGQRIGSATSDRDGRFRIPELLSGRYKPTAHAPGRFGTTHESVLLGFGQSVDGVVIPVFPASNVTGHIVVDDPTGARHDLHRASVGFTTASGRCFRADAARDGTVRIDGVPSGTYSVSVRCEGLLSEVAYADVVVGDEDISALEWKVRVGATIAGRVRIHDGAPIAGARLIAETIDAGRAGSLWRTSDHNGDFAFVGVGAGTYRVCAAARGHLAPEPDPTVVVDAGKTVHVDLALDPSSAITGHVVDDRGHPVRNVSIEAYPHGPGRHDHHLLDERTADDGSFTLRSLSPGRYRVQTWRRSGSQEVVVPAARTASVRLVVESASGAIAGTVIDETGEPARDVFVTAEREDDLHSERSMRSAIGDRVVTDSTGAFELTSLPPGMYAVRAYRHGGADKIVEHVAIDTRDLRFRLEPTGSITGSVIVEGGAVLDDFAITAIDAAQGFERRESFFRTGGAFTLLGLPGGTFTLRASAPRGEATGIVVLPSGEHRRDVVLAIRPRVAVKGRLVAHDDRSPASDMGVHVRSATAMSEEQGRRSITGPDGRFVVEGVSTGDITINASPLDFDRSTFGTNSVSRSIGDAPETDIGDIVVPRRRIGMGETSGDLGFQLVLCRTQPGLDVQDVRPDGPAAAAGLLVDDVIVSIDAADIRDMSVLSAVQLLRVRAGTALTLGLERGATVTIIASERRDK